MTRLATGMAGRDLGAVLLHLYPFGGIADTVAWAARAAGRHMTESEGALGETRYP
ncbi:hypothetical protein FQZ97_1071840 [compost metagenome]